MPDLYDCGLRLDVVDALLARAEGDDDGDSIWLTRPGVPEHHDVDTRWRASTRHVCSARGRTLSGFWVVTRYGWLDPDTGASRTWKRLRL